MCHDALPEDLARSRARLSDLPAFLLVHRPIRCRLCHERYFVLAPSKGGLTLLPKLWMHYTVLALVAALIAGVAYHETHKASSPEHPSSGIARLAPLQGA